MSDVKRYTADVATCVDVLPAESVYGAKVVLASDYAALEAKNSAFAEANERLIGTINDLVDECDQLKAELAQLRAAQEGGK